MITDTEIKITGFQILAKNMGDVEAERFIALIQREPFDYTKWRKNIDEDLSIEEISSKAMKIRNSQQEVPVDS
jgi:hypothetical protein